jgi:membrane protease YdiL (CAAX protease family)
MSNASSKAHTPDTSTEPSDKENANWNPWWGIVFFFLVFFGSQVLAGVLLSLYPVTKSYNSQQATDWIANSIAAQFCFMLLAMGLIVVMVRAFVRRYGNSLADVGLRRPRGADILYGLSSIVPYFVLYLVTAGVLSALLPDLDTGQKQELGFNNVHGAAELTLTFISLVVLPPIGEEILFRGFLFSTFKKLLPVVSAAIGTSLIFAAAHLPEGGAAGPLYIAAIDTFVLSLVLTYLRQRTGGLWAGMLLHAIKNGIAFVLLYVAPHIHFGI